MCHIDANTHRIVTECLRNSNSTLTELTIPFYVLKFIIKFRSPAKSRIIRKRIFLYTFFRPSIIIIHWLIPANWSNLTFKVTRTILSNLGIRLACSLKRIIGLRYASHSSITLLMTWTSCPCKKSSASLVNTRMWEALIIRKTKPSWK